MAIGHRAAGLLEAPVHLPESVQPLGGRRRRESEGERLQRTENVADLTELGGVDGADSEAASHGRLEDAVVKMYHGDVRHPF